MFVRSKTTDVDKLSNEWNVLNGNRAVGMDKDNAERSAGGTGIQFAGLTCEDLNLVIGGLIIV